MPPASADALVVVDVQRGLVSGESAVRDAAGFLDRWSGALLAARAAGVSVIHLQDDGADDPLLRRGTPGWELVLPVADSDVVVTKTADDGFVDTGLEDAAAGWRT